MKKAISAFAIITLIGVLCAGCAAESPDVSTSPDSETIRVTETTTPGEAAAQATSELILSGSNQNTDMPQQSESRKSSHLRRRKQTRNSSRRKLRQRSERPTRLPRQKSR